MLTAQGTQQKYSNCLTRAVMWLRKNNYPVNSDISIIAKKDAGNVIVKMTNFLHCMDWPERNGDGKKKIDILASIVETISLETEACTRATCHVNYFRIKNNWATLTESLHYDYDCPPKTKHPICHVQNSNDSLDKRGSWPESFRKRRINPSELGNRCQNVRIPSAFVNLPGLLAILAADHMSETQWHKFMGHCLVHFCKIPPMEGHAVVDRAKEGLCAWNWYEMKQRQPLNDGAEPSECLR